MRISDNELTSALRSMIHRGMGEAIIGIRHCNFDNPSYKDIKAIDHYTQVIEYFYHLQRYRIAATQRMKGYRQLLHNRGEAIKKLRYNLRSRKTVTEWAPMPEEFFEG